MRFLATFKNVWTFVSDPVGTSSPDNPCMFAGGKGLLPCSQSWGLRIYSDALIPIKNSLRGSAVNNDTLKDKIVVLADFLPSVQVVVKMQDSSFQN